MSLGGRVDSLINATLERRAPIEDPGFRYIIVEAGGKMDEETDAFIDYLKGQIETFLNYLKDVRNLSANTLDSFLGRFNSKTEG